jgi:hypothetical protein
VANMSAPHVSDGEMDPGGFSRLSFCVDMSLSLLRYGKRASGA